MLVSILAPLDFRTSQLTTSLLVKVAPGPWVGGSTCSGAGRTDIPVGEGGVHWPVIPAFDPPQPTLI